MQLAYFVVLRNEVGVDLPSSGKTRVLLFCGDSKASGIRRRRTASIEKPLAISNETATHSMSRKEDAGGDQVLLRMLSPFGGPHPK